MRKYYSYDGVNLQTLVLICSTDGGPDHRITYKSMKLCVLIEFVVHDLNTIVCARIALRGYKPFRMLNWRYGKEKVHTCTCIYVCENYKRCMLW